MGKDAERGRLHSGAPPKLYEEVPKKEETMPELSGVERRYRLPLSAPDYLLAGYGFIHSIEGDFSCQGKVRLDSCCAAA
jgi:hypothetical protein